MHDAFVHESMHASVHAYINESIHASIDRMVAMHLTFKLGNILTSSMLPRITAQNIYFMCRKINIEKLIIILDGKIYFFVAQGKSSLELDARSEQPIFIQL